MAWRFFRGASVSGSAAGGRARRRVEPGAPGLSPAPTPRPATKQGSVPTIGWAADAWAAAGPSSPKNDAWACRIFIKRVKPRKLKIWEFRMIALVTGASAGFGEAICAALVEKGYRVIGAARRLGKLEEMRRRLGENFLPLQMDVSDAKSIDAAWDAIPDEQKEVDVLVNNAGKALGLEKAQETDPDDWLQMIATNVTGLTYLTRKVLPGMARRKRGYVINMGSIAGSYPYPGGNVYGATKAYVKQFSRNLRNDLVGTGVRVSNIEPGLCGGTEFSNVRFKGDDKRAAAVYENVSCVTAKDIADVVVWLLDRPSHVNVNSIEVMPTSQTWAALNVYRDQA